MKDSRTSDANFWAAVARRAPWVRATLLVAMTTGVLTGCLHRDPDRKKKPPKHRDPVEQKVFYDGWWPKRD